LYNKKIFNKLGLQPPKTEAEFWALPDKVKKDGSVAPLALGTADQWESSQIIFTNIGPNHWRGEEGRKALIAGTAKFTDAPFISAFEAVAKLGTYLGKGASAQTYGDSQNQFALGRAAIYPTGSWDISYFNQTPGLELGAFAPPVKKAGDKCFISDHTDIGIGINKKSKNKEDALKFIAWVGSQEFADIYTNKVTGFFSLSTHLIAVRDPVAKQMVDWRATCGSTIRLNSQVLNRGTPSMENELWNVNAQLLNGKLTPKDAAAKMQAGFAKWYAPQQK
jgi:raffinose/stachyose/melibiose transport system substrate-binding protein